ncbi:14749_t:CDS:2 [Racocetra fulgida]|uniref:14749_t:CDS:1 n=1 Tax=Racocetra fulgida TaxID=60492 RepID=A0A9N9CTQ2_9GLOM|nr:14749_t:CDS:2 [Racocetra fulgida]
MENAARIDVIADRRQRAIVSTEPNQNHSQRFISICNKVINDWCLTKQEKKHLVDDLIITRDSQNVIENIGDKKTCKWCNKQAIAITYCECGNSIIYTATWENGPFTKWDDKQQELKRGGEIICILKTLKDLEKSADESLVKCYGLTKDPETQTFMLVLHKMDSDLRQFLEENTDLPWKIKFKMDLLKDIYQSEDIPYELKFIPIIPEESRIWKILKSGIRKIIKMCKVLKEIIDKINMKKNNFQTRGINISNYQSFPLKQDEQSVSDNVSSIFEHDQKYLLDRISDYASIISEPEKEIPNCIPEDEANLVNDIININ